MKHRQRKDLKRFNAKYRRGKAAPAVGSPEDAADQTPPVRTFSWTYFFGIPLLSTAAIGCFYSAYQAYFNSIDAGKAWAVFSLGAAVSFIAWSNLKLSRLRTMMHEFKHAMVVMLTGGKVDRISVAGDGSGEIEYTQYEGQQHFTPIIMLAPYFFPLLSLPMLLIALVSTSDTRLACSLLLGMAYFADLATGIADLGPHQTDIENIIGRFYLAGPFLATAHFAWFGILTIWITAGTAGYLKLWQLLVEATAKLI